MQNLLRVAVVCALSSVAAFAQGGRSTILGTVTDQTGAPVPKVSITVTNTGTQQSRSTVTSERGDFEITALDVGAYDLQAEHPGFRIAVIRSIQLEVDQCARADVHLQLGEVSQRVEVEGNPVAVQTDDSTLSTVMDAAK